MAFASSQVITALGSSVAVVGHNGISFEVKVAPSTMNAFHTSLQPFLTLLLYIIASFFSKYKFFDKSFNFFRKVSIKNNSEK